MTKFTHLLLALVCVACSTEDEPSTDCALGDYALLETTTTGTCGLEPGTELPLNFTVVDTGNDLGVLCADCDSAAVFVEATSDSCSIDAMLTFTDPAEGISEVHAFDATIDNRQIVGTGSANVSFTDGTSCVQNFTLSGLLR